MDSASVVNWLKSSLNNDVFGLISKISVDMYAEAIIIASEHKRYNNACESGDRLSDEEVESLVGLAITEWDYEYEMGIDSVYLCVTRKRPLTVVRKPIRRIPDWCWENEFMIPYL